MRCSPASWFAFANAQIDYKTLNIITNYEESCSSLIDT
nr:MAG TPA: hypothetical protein [Caudoviricetes sp.]